MLNEGNQIHTFISNFGSGAYGSGSGSTTLIAIYEIRI
jgi:hypothetical protein